MPSEGEEMLHLLLRTIAQELMYPACQREYRFHERRRWRFDFAFPTPRIAIEYEGSWHRTKERFAPDMDKYNCAQIAGWTVLRFGRKQLNDGRAEKQIRRMLGQLIPKYDKPLEPGERKWWPDRGVYSDRSHNERTAKETHAPSEKGRRSEEGGEEAAAQGPPGRRAPGS